MYIHYIDGADGVDLNCSCLFVLSVSRSLLYAKSPLLSIKAILKCPSIGFRENMQGTPFFGWSYPQFRSDFHPNKPLRI